MGDYRTPTGRPTFPGIGVIGVKSWQKTRKNRGQSEISPRCLNAVNPAVALSAPKYQVPNSGLELHTAELTLHAAGRKTTGRNWTEQEAFARAGFRLSCRRGAAGRGDRL